MAAVSPLFDPPVFERLLRDARAGSRPALGQLLLPFEPILERLSAHLVPYDFRAKLGISDVIQEALLLGVERFSQFRGRTQEELMAWLIATLRHRLAHLIEECHQAKRDVRREKRLQPYGGRSGEPLSQEALPDARLMAKEAAEYLKIALHELPAYDRQLLCLRYDDGLSFEAVAEFLGQSVPAVRQAHVRILKRLARRLRPVLRGGGGTSPVVCALRDGKDPASLCGSSEALTPTRRGGNSR